MREADSKIVAREELREKLAEHKRHGQRIVFANGCFDTLHVGHVRYLEGGRREGDVLVVGVNADSSVCNLKGPGGLSSMKALGGNWLAGCVALIMSCSLPSPTWKLSWGRFDPTFTP